MAAILCTSIGKILGGTCDAVGTILTLPCKACGIATGQLTNLCRSPFCLFLTVAVGLNLPPIIFAGKTWGKGYDDEGCIAAFNWLNVNASLCLINVAAALYITAKITYKEPEDENAAPFVDASITEKETGEKSTEKTLVQKVMESDNNTRSRSFSRVREILCNDPAVAVYIIIGIFYMVWQVMGVSRRVEAGECDAGLGQYLSYAFTCGFLFISMGPMVFACSLCCVTR